MKVIYTSDLHGNHDFYMELIQISKRERINAVVLGGDLFPKRGHFTDSLKYQRRFVRDGMHRFFSRLKQEGVEFIYIILGNDDWIATLNELKKLESENLLNLLHKKIYHLTDNTIITGYPYVPPTPFSPKDFEKLDLRKDPPRSTAHTPSISHSGHIVLIDECAYFTQCNSIEDDLLTITKPGPNQRAIYVMHGPPYNTTLDQLYDGTSIGSKAIQNFIEKEQPFITLHGHIHESPDISGRYWQKTGVTLSINPGQTEHHLSAVIFDPTQPEETMRHTLYGPIKTKDT